LGALTPDEERNVQIKDTSFVNQERKAQELVPVFQRLQRPNFDPSAGMEGYAFACMQLEAAL
jgi:hypothetical protein